MNKLNALIARARLILIAEEMRQQIQRKNHDYTAPRNHANYMH